MLMAALFLMPSISSGVFSKLRWGTSKLLLVKALQALVEIEMALLVFTPAAAPTLVVATGAFQIIVHTASFRLRSIVTLLALAKSQNPPETRKPPGMDSAASFDA